MGAQDRLEAATAVYDNVRAGIRYLTWKGRDEMRKLLITLIAIGSISGSAFAMDNSQGEGSYYGGSYESRSGLQNSQGAAGHYYGGGSNQSPPTYGVPEHPAGGSCRGYGTDCD